MPLYNGQWERIRQLHACRNCSSSILVKKPKFTDDKSNTNLSLSFDQQFVCRSEHSSIQRTHVSRRMLKSKLCNFNTVIILETCLLNDEFQLCMLKNKDYAKEGWGSAIVRTKN